jgi:release factor glutamine methyltransferase
MSQARAQHAEQPWTTRRLLAWMTDTFTKKDLDSPRLCAELLMAHVIGCERLRLYMEADRPASPLERETLRGLVARALKHEPVQYLVGQAWFFSLPFHVDKRVLIPRPATETIVERVLQHVRVEPNFGGPSGDGVLLADVCTGSGCIAVALLKNMTAARAVATDISEGALEIARQNAQRHKVADRIDFLQGNLLDPLLDFPATRGKGSLNYLVCNPPYIPDHEWADVPPNVKDHEPASALRGGPDGLDYVRPILDYGPALLKPGGLLLVEIAASSADAAMDLLKARPDLTDAQVLQDHEGHPRVLTGRRM